jgi:hypothetical protein
MPEERPVADTVASKNNRIGPRWCPRWLWLGAPPILVWLFSRTVVTMTTPMSNTFDFRASTWTRWDSYYYIYIAGHDRRLVHGCTVLLNFRWKYCGSAGWLPAYSYAVRAVAEVTRLSIPAAGVLASNLFAVATFAVVWICVLKGRPPAQALGTLALLSVFPGAVYLYAIFPMSLALFGIVSSMVALHRRHRVLAALLLAVSIPSYPTAIYVLPAFVAALALSVPAGRRLRTSLLGLIPLVGYVALFVHDQIVFGHWNAYFLVQHQFGNTIFPPRNPLAGLWHVLVSETWKSQLVTHRAKHWIAAQALLATIVCVGALVVVVMRRRKRIHAALEVYPASGAFLVWLGILMSGVGAGWSRGILLAAPAVVMTKRVPRWVTWVLLAAMTIVTAKISRYFFNFQIL